MVGHEPTGEDKTGEEKGSINFKSGRYWTAVQVPRFSQLLSANQ